MSFVFNFSGSSNEISHDSESGLCLKEDAEIDQNSILVPCKYIPLQDINLNQVSCHKEAKKAKYGDLEIQYITHKVIASEVENSGLIDDHQSDLLPGKYEGGLKVWECSFDLAQFLIEKNCIQANNLVLELGCGAGLPGIAAYMCGASVTFQDFNSEVLELITAPNVFMNTSEEQQSSISEKCQFLCGDWQCILEKFYITTQENKQFDIILTSETIYEKNNQRKLLNLMKAALKPSGVIYLASKVHYFGVGGGIAEFIELVEKDGALDFTTVFIVNEGVQRKILRLVFKNVE